VRSALILCDNPLFISKKKSIFFLCSLGLEQHPHKRLSPDYPQDGRCGLVELFGCGLLEGLGCALAECGFAECLF
jgi:hypothetical protein